MKKKIIILSILILLLLSFFIINKEKKQNYILYKPEIGNIYVKSIISGEIVPSDIIDIKSNISGIVNKLYIKQGDFVKTGQLIAIIKSVPDISQVNSRLNSLNNSKLSLDNEKIKFIRIKKLYKEGIVSKMEYENQKYSYDIALSNFNSEREQYNIAKKGTSMKFKEFSNNHVKSNLEGIVLDIISKKGDYVVGVNNVNTGSTIIKIANTKSMIFRGSVDESDINSIKNGMNISILTTAIPGKFIKGKIKFISPQAIQTNGIRKFPVEADLNLVDLNIDIRSGYSANAEIILNKIENVLKIKNSCIQYDTNNIPYVDIQQIGKNENSFIRKNIQLGISDGFYTEVKSGITINDIIKIPDLGK